MLQAMAALNELAGLIPRMTLERSFGGEQCQIETMVFDCEYGLRNGTLSSLSKIVQPVLLRLISLPELELVKNFVRKRKET